MGRPLHKKYFGNRNIGTTGTSDNKIGGEGLATIPVGSPNLTAVGNYVDRLPSVLSIGAPTLPGGVTASGATVYAVTGYAQPVARGTGYQVGDQLTDANGSVWAVTELEVATATLDPLNQGSGYAGDDTIPYPGYGIRINLDGVDGGGTPTGTINFTTGGASRGSFTDAGAPPTTTGSQIPGLGGTGAQWLLTWGVKGLFKVSSPTFNDDTGLAYTGALATTSLPSSGRSGATLTSSYQVASVTFDEKGSGYTGVEAITFTTAPGENESRATATAKLTTDTGNVGSATNQENAIVIRAKIDAEATVRVGDIVKQSSARRYKVKTSDGTAVCKLVADDTPATFEAYITATDDNGNTYFVTKLTAHRVTVQQWVNNEATWLFANGTTAPWSFTSTANGRVIIENA